jgi:hypothetical protein
MDRSSDVARKVGLPVGSIHSLSVTTKTLYLRMNVSFAPDAVIP